MLNVLLVDDEPWVIEGLRSMVDWEGQGFQVCGEAVSGPDALQMIEQLQPELVVTDIHMPVLNGLQLVEKSNQLLEFPPKFIILSGYDDFNYAQTAIKNQVTDYLLKPIDEHEIEDLLRRIARTISEEKATEQHRFHQQTLFVNNILNRLIQGEFNTELEQQALQALNLRTDTKLRCLLVNTLPGTGQQQVVAAMRVCYPDTVDRTFLDYKGRAGIILIEEAHGDQGREEKGQRLYQELSKRLEQPVIIAISEAGTGPVSIRDLYLSAREIGKSKRCQAKFGVFTQRPVRQNDEPAELFKKWLFELERAVLGHDFSEITRLANHNVFTQESGLAAFECVKSMVADLEMRIYRHILDMNGDAEQWMSEFQQRQGQLSQIDNYSRLENYIQDLSLGAGALLYELVQENKYNTLAHVIQYVDKEFRSKLQLRDLAKHFHMNATYLGQRFKKETGKTFNEYVNDKRINEAKFLLKRTNKKIVEVALEVGFPNADYFVSKFKQSTGMLPSAYKQDAAGHQPVE